MRALTSILEQTGEIEISNEMRARGQWFTSRVIAEYLGLPLSTVQLALRQVDRMAPRVQSEDIRPIIEVGVRKGIVFRP